MLNENRQQRVEQALAWLLPITYLIHVTEEYVAGVALSTSPTGMLGANLTPTQFILLNALGCVLIIAGMLIAKRLKFRTWMLACLWTVALVNGLYHVAESIRMAGYTPGLISGLVIWIPLGLAALICLRRKILPVKFWMALGAGTFINVVVLLLARSGRRLFEG